ncbi:MAG: hypothetical protein HYS12_27885 [Planctomycetes bacterium]|nr:hypothetical protein [Planctomycetota bacterium]
MKVRLLAGDIHLTDLRTRMPFRYGIATMTRSPHAFVRMHIEVDGVASTGVAADLLPPKWFTKDPTRPVDEEVNEMLRVIEHAVAAATGLKADSPFDAWRALWDIQDRWGREQGLPPLLTHFGTSLVERAMIEAVCRKLGQPFHVALTENLFGIRLGEIHAPLAGRTTEELLLDRPLKYITPRHTIGLLDPLREAGIPSEERLDDGLPQSLEACIRTYRFACCKIKLQGNSGHDRGRLLDIFALFAACTPGFCFFSLDGNEGFRSLDTFRQYWRKMEADPQLRYFLSQRLMFVEQPFSRNVALDPETVGGLKDWKRHPALIIDESDAELTSLPRALELGYDGTSHKNCKGVFKGIANACLLAHLRREGLRKLVILSGEDLANVGPVALLQDLAVCAALGIESVERNGHHYFAGLSMFPKEVQRQILASHPDLYHLSRDLWPTLTIEDGRLSLKSINAAPFGVAPLVNVEQFTPLAEWRSRKADAPGT